VNNGQMKSVINLSIAGGYSQSVTDAIAAATDAGFLIVAAAGNDATSACFITPASSPDVSCHLQNQVLYIYYLPV
jgi:subtilisin family serine protease